MPKIVKREDQKPETPKQTDIDIWWTLRWEVGDQIDVSPYWTGKLHLHGAVVGEITLLRSGFSVVAQQLAELGVRVVVDYVPLTKMMADIRDRPPLPKKGQLGFK